MIEWYDRAVSRHTRHMLIALLLLSAAVQASAAKRAFHLFTQQDGLPVDSVYALAQDSRGFIWIGTLGGLVRYDGIEMRPWAKQVLPGEVVLLAAGPSGRLVAGKGRPQRELYEVGPDGAQPFLGPDGNHLTGASHIAFDDDGALWIVADSRLLHQDPQGAWSEVTRETFGGEEVLRAVPRNGAHLWVVTREGVWSFDGHGGEKVLAQRAILDVATGEDGSLIAGTFEGSVLRVRDGTVTEIADMGTRVISLVRRRDTIWASGGTRLAAFPPDGPAEFMGFEDGINGGGPLLLDSEGSLWMGSFVGLFQFPEPDTRLWTQRDGLPTNHARYVVYGQDRIWVGTWKGLAWLAPAAAPRDVGVPRGFVSRSRLCADGGGRVWTPGIVGEGTDERRDMLVALDHEKTVLHEWQAAFDCFTREDGSVWITREGDLFLVRPEDPAPSWVARIHGESERTYIAEAVDRLWALVRGSRLCQVAFTGDPVALATAEWSCEELPAVGDTVDLHVVANGRPWIATVDQGALERTESGFAPVVPIEKLSSPSILGFAHSPKEGTWVFGH